ncbi:class I adenylate-forming enzyme family protein [Dactylosporangium sp. NPDC000244]|uniref:class I adenylate-forming enzyme family protein n=1 Tax=Dactylosporangium sp. NPDC000244 TaxID=3154365 RepID=UPI00332F2400
MADASDYSPMAPDLLRLRAREHGDRVPFTVGAEPGPSYAEWDRRSDRVAAALARRGHGRGDRIALLFGGMDWTDYAIAYAGVLKTGATAVHLPATLGAADLADRLGECGAGEAVVGAGVAPPAGVTVHTVAGLAAAGTGFAPTVAVAPHDIADILYTSGTTGRPKAFTNPHGALTYGRGPAALASFDGSAPLLAPMPLGTPSSASTVGMLALTTTSAVVICPVDDVELMAALTARFGVVSLMLTPWTAIRLANARVHERYDLSRVRRLALASAALPPAVARRLAAMMPGLLISTAYAQGEAAPAVVLNTYDPDRPLCVGRPGPGTELRVAGPGGEPVPTGEIWLRCQAPKRLYLDEARNREIHADGWTRTRDLGRLAADGRLELIDRAADALPTPSGWLSTLEVEHAAYEHPGVVEATAYGGTDADGAPWLRIAVVLAPGHAVDGPEGVAEVVAGHLPADAPPWRVERHERLPRGITGKVLKHVLRDGRRAVTSGGVHV